MSDVAAAPAAVEANAPSTSDAEPAAAPIAPSLQAALDAVAAAAAKLQQAIAAAKLTQVALDDSPNDEDNQKKNAKAEAARDAAEQAHAAALVRLEAEKERLEAERLAAIEAARVAEIRRQKSRCRVSLLEEINQNALVAHFVHQESADIIQDCPNTYATFYRDVDEHLIVPDELGGAIETGRLAYMKRCAELSCPPSAKFLKQLGAGQASIDLAHYGLGEEGVLALAELLKVNKSITALNLEDNACGAAATQALAQAFDQNLKQRLVALNLSHNTAIPVKTMMAALKPLVRANKLHHLVLRQNRLNDSVAQLIAESALASGGMPIRHLDLSHNELTERGAEALAKFLSSKHSLSELHLSWNNIREAGGKAIAQALAASASRTLERVSVSWTGAGAVAGQAWAAALSAGGGLASLQSLDLSNNRLDAAAAQALAAALAANKTLTHVDLSANPFASTAATDELLAALHGNATLRSFRISTQGKLVEVDRQHPQPYAPEVARTRSTFF